MDTLVKRRVGRIIWVVILSLVIVAIGMFYIMFYFHGVANYPRVITARKQYSILVRNMGLGGAQYSYHWLTTPYTITIDQAMNDGSYLYRMVGKWEGMDVTQGNVVYVRDRRGERYGFRVSYKRMEDGRYELSYFAEDGEFNKIKGVKQRVGSGEGIGEGDIVEVVWKSPLTMDEIQQKLKQGENRVVNEGMGVNATTIIWHPGR
jgi:hypothetical protein